MNKAIASLLKVASTVVLAISTATPAYAQTTSLCVPGGTTLGFFNGVRTTRVQAEISLNKLKSIYGNTDATGKKLRYELFYNWTNGFEDFVETFRQRLNEQSTQLDNRYELFFGAIRGGNGWLDSIGGAITTLPDLIRSFTDYANARDAAALTSLFANPPTFSNYVEQKARVDTLILEGNKLLFLPHSQGNLFANSAYAYARTKVSANSVKVVHIAPASPTLNGPHTLADLDLVINALRVAGTVPPVTHSIPGYLLRPAGLNGEKDLLGHGLLEIYLNPALQTRAAIDSNVQAALQSLVAPATAGTAGFFTVTLTWNGSGDVDLHSFEPGGAHVYYAAATGTAGFLDVDNVIANGPEHYYASCDPAKLQTGTYRIGINNFADATGRTATVQVSSFKEGPLLTRSLGVGAVRGTSGNGSPIPVMNVTVTKNAVTGEYRVEAASSSSSAQGLPFDQASTRAVKAPLWSVYR